MNQNRNLHSLSKLTEFARHVDDDDGDESNTLFASFINKIQNAYNQSYNTVNEISSSNHLTNTSQSRTQFKQNDSGHDACATSTNSTFANNNLNNKQGNENNPETMVNEGRTMLNVLLRIRNLVASKDNSLREYKDTDLHRFWMPDSKAKECYDCSQKFSAFKRKHHCRLCGQIFCSKCCNQMVSGKIIMCSGDLKVCNYCSKIVLGYLQTPNMTRDLNSDLQALQQDLSNKLESSKLGNRFPVADMTALDTRTQKRKISVGYQEERLALHQPHINLTMDDRKNLLQQCNSLIALFEEMFSALPAENSGLELIDFLNRNHKSSNKIQAITILKAMLDAGFLEPAIQPIVSDTDSMEFEENSLYRFVAQVSREKLIMNYNEDSVEGKNLNSDPFAKVLHPPKLLDTPFDNRALNDLDVDNTMHITASKLLESYCDHEDQLLTQMLRSYNLNLQWAHILTPLCCRIANHFNPEQCTHELMDIRNYVNVKKLPGGRSSESTIVGGVVFTKNIAHKAMATRIEQPRILLLQCPIVYERIEGKFVSISTVLLQEKEYLRNVCARIMSFKANIVLVHKNVAGIAQDMLRQQGITLVLDVKLTVMERLARTFECDILTTIEGNISKPHLGTCDLFYIRSYPDNDGTMKTLMHFEKFNSPRGYTCLLRGGSYKELSKVKKIASFLIYARYNWRLEMSFLLNEFAEALAPKPLIFDSKDTSPEGRTSNLLMKDEGRNSTNSTKGIKTVERKIDDRTVCSNVTDVSHEFSDPLRSKDNLNGKRNSNSNLKLAVEHRNHDDRFRSALSSTILSVSPFLSFPLPFLETEQGRKCPLRSLFPNELYYSKLFSTSSSSSTNTHTLIERIDSSEIIPTSTTDSQLNPSHAFLELKIIKPIDDREIQTLLAEFRAFACHYTKTKHIFKLSNERNEEKAKRLSEDIIYKDALDIENHQRLPVLFCSFFYNQKGPSSFCAPPTLLDMKFYGQHDIMLGTFLQRYCFRLWANCTRCNLPMLGHIRRYVHSMGCVKVFLSEENSNSNANNIYFSAWCTICNAIIPSIPLSETAKCLSLAKYLELRFHGHIYKKRCLPGEKTDSPTKCQHSLHRDYIHQFSYGGVAAKFQYAPIETWDIILPSLTINLCPPSSFNRFELIDDIKNFSMKGHEVYTRIHGRIADLATEEDNSPFLNSLKNTLSKNQYTFKQHVEVIQTLLTEDHASIYAINDAMLMAKRLLAENIEWWEPRLHELVLAQKLNAKQSQQDSIQHCVVETAAACTEDIPSEKSDNSSDTTQQPNPEDTENRNTAGDSPASDHTTAEKSNTENLNILSSMTTDKKSIKKMLNHLLPSTNPVILVPSPFASQEHHTLPLGAFPLIVNDQDFSSIIAYSLTCDEYKRIVHNCNSFNQATTSGSDPAFISNATTTGVYSSPHGKRKFHDSTCDIEENSKEKEPNVTIEEERIKTKTNQSHVEIVFQDSNAQFTCKIYFAREFEQMRSRTLKPSQPTDIPTKTEMECKNKLDDLSGKIGGDDDGNLAWDDCRNYYARSLCNSIRWEAKGGKSGSRFCKTLDDRFVLKEMFKSDINIFENFAPNYFEYISKCQQQSQPTLLAKIFGVYKVTIKKRDSTVEKSLLIMENLFYGCDIRNKFDLKGSERNRLVDPMLQQQGDIVLLDENLVQMSWSKPLYILTCSKIILKETINRDACFLEKNQVMDYSLLVGLDEKNGSLVLGIIDYIRTFTFEKKVESFVKQRGILGGMGKLPTVIPPQPYRQRFADAMDRYFHTVPDRWEGLSKI